MVTIKILNVIYYKFFFIAFTIIKFGRFYNKFDALKQIH